MPCSIVCLLPTKVHTRARRPAQRTPRPRNSHSDPDLQIRQPCGVRGWGEAGGGAAGRTPERQVGGSVASDAEKLAKPQSWGAAPRFAGFPPNPPKFTSECAGPPSTPPAPRICTVTQTYKSGSPVVPGGGEGQGVVLLGAPRNESLES